LLLPLGPTWSRFPQAFDHFDQLVRPHFLQRRVRFFPGTKVSLPRAPIVMTFPLLLGCFGSSVFSACCFFPLPQKAALYLVPSSKKLYNTGQPTSPAASSFPPGVLANTSSCISVFSPLAFCLSRRFGSYQPRSAFRLFIFFYNPFNSGRSMPELVPFRCPTDALFPPVSLPSWKIRGSNSPVSVSPTTPFYCTVFRHSSLFKNEPVRILTLQEQGFFPP